MLTSRRQRTIGWPGEGPQTDWLRLQLGLVDLLHQLHHLRDSLQHLLQMDRPGMVHSDYLAVLWYCVYWHGVCA